MGLEDFGENYEKDSKVRFDKPIDFEDLNNLMFHIGNSPDYNIRWGYSVENNVRANPLEKSTQKTRSKTIGKITGQILLPQIIGVDFECLEEIDEEDRVVYEGMQFSLFGSHYHPQERMQTWSDVRERVKSYFNLKTQDEAFSSA